MSLNRSTDGGGRESRNGRQSLLVVGPLPPPLGGATISVQVLLDELAKQSEVQPIILNTSPRDYQKQTSLTELNTLTRAVRIVRQYACNVGNSDAVLIYATSTFIFTVGYALLLLARKYRVPVYLKPLGAELGPRLARQKNPGRAYMMMVLRGASGVLVQTRQLQAELVGLGCTNTHYVPGYRPAQPFAEQPKPNPHEFHLLFLSQIMREKGPLLLLEALRLLARQNGVSVTCDFYGPILAQERAEFLRQLQATPGARYCGVTEAGTASQLMARYDALAFPTYFHAEGHPGVIIEAMQAGIPVISSRHQATTELITDGENGLLVPVKDSAQLALAIERLASDRLLCEEMGKANYRRGQEFRSDLVVPRMLEIVLPGFASRSAAEKRFGNRQVSFRDGVVGERGTR